MQGHSENDERRERILNAAAKLIAHYGYDKTTMSDIARDAGVSKGAIYLHFDSKEALLDSLFWRDVWAYTDMWLDRMDADPDGGTIGGMYSNALVCMREFPLILALFGRDRRIMGNYAREHNPSWIQQKLMFRGTFLKKLQDAGVIRQGIDLEAMEYLIAVMNYGLITVVDIIPDEEAPDFERVMAQFTDMLDRTLSPDDGGNSEAGKTIMRQMTQALREQMELVRSGQQNAGRKND